MCQSLFTACWCNVCLHCVIISWWMLNLLYVASKAYLGATMTSEGSCAQDIQKALGVMSGLQKIWKSKSITLWTKLRLLKALVWPMATHGCESWTLRKAEQRKIDAFELKTYRRLLRIPWTDKRTNDSVMQEVGNDRQLLTSPSANYATSDILCDVQVNVWRKRWFRDVSREAEQEGDWRDLGLMTYWRQRTAHWVSCCVSRKTAKHGERWSIRRPTISTDEGHYFPSTPIDIKWAVMIVWGVWED